MSRRLIGATLLCVGCAAAQLAVVPFYASADQRESAATGSIVRARACGALSRTAGP